MGAASDDDWGDLLLDVGLPPGVDDLRVRGAQGRKHRHRTLRSTLFSSNALLPFRSCSSIVAWATWP